MDAIVDANKADTTNEVLELLDAEVSSFSYEGFDTFLVSLALLLEDLFSWHFLKEEYAETRRNFEVGSEVFDSISEE